MAQMKIASWNLNNRVGMVPFRLDAAKAAIAIDADVFVFNEYYPQSHAGEFCAILKNAGWEHQRLSVETGEKANRVFIASRVELEPLEIALPDFDQQFAANILGVRVPEFGVSILGIRLPWYNKLDLVTSAWSWLEGTAAELMPTPSIILGDLNANLSSKISRGGDHFRRIVSSGWQRSAPVGGFSYFGRQGKCSEIDHILSSGACLVQNARYVIKNEQFTYAGEEESLLDHAVLVADVALEKQ